MSPGPDLDATLPEADGAAPAAGAVIGRYRIEHSLGRGGMGVVVAGFDPDLGRKVAIKILHDGGGGGTGSVGDRLRREAQALARVTHPNVVAVYDAGVAGSPYLVMQLVEGETLGEHLRRNRPAPAQILALFAQAMRGLGAIHAAGLVHRDVKPSNLLVDRDQVVRVSDLGLARIGELAQAGEAGAQVGASGSTITQGLAGTPAYMAPEQLVGAEVTAATDQFSLCVALWEALFATRPFVGDTLDQQHAAIVRAELPSTRPAGVSRRVVRALRRGLSADPAARFPSMEALAQALAPRARRPVALLAAALVVVVGGVVLALGRQGRSGPSPAGGDRAGAGAAAAASAPLDVVPDSIRRLSMTAVCEEYPTIGPDGTIYYDGAIGADTVLYALGPGDGPPRQLTEVDGWDLAVVPSPDGSHLAWLRRTDQPMGLVVAPREHLEQVRRLRTGGARPFWSPDGRHVWGGGENDLTRIALATGEVVRRIQLPAGIRPVYGHELADGTVLVLTHSGSAIADGIVAYDRGADTPRWIMPTDPTFPMEEVFELTPDRRAVIVAQVTPTSTIETWQVPLDGGPRVRLFGSAVAARKRLALHAGTAVWSDCAEHTNLARVEFAGPGPARLVDLTSNPWFDVWPVEVPGSGDFVFISYRLGSDALWRAPGGDIQAARQVDLGGLLPDLVAVSHDGAQLAVVTAEGLFLTPLAGGAPPRQLLPADDGEQQVTFSRTGDRVFVAQTAGEARSIVVVPTAGGPATELVPHLAFSPAHAPRGDTLAYLAAAPTAAPGQRVSAFVPMLRDLRTGSTRPLAPAMAPYPWSDLRWSGDGTRLLLSRRDGASAEIEVATGRELRRFDVGADLLLGVSYLRDEIVVARTTWVGDLWSARLR